MFLEVQNKLPSWWLWYGPSECKSLRRKRSPCFSFWRVRCLQRCFPGDCGVSLGKRQKANRTWRIKYYLEWQTMHSWAVYGHRGHRERCCLAQSLICATSHLSYRSVTLLWNFFFTSLFWLGSSIHKIPREWEVWSIACKRRRGEVGEWIEEESFPLPCHSLPNTGLMPLSSSPKQQASEKRREQERRGEGKLPSLFSRQDLSPSR